MKLSGSNIRKCFIFQETKPSTPTPHHPKIEHKKKRIPHISGNGTFLNFNPKLEKLPILQEELPKPKKQTKRSALKTFLVSLQQ